MSLRQNDDVMFERNIAIIASRKQEVLVDSDGILYEGFLCGLDEKWVQIYGHDQADREDPDLSWRFVLINKDRVNTIRTSGRVIKDLPLSNREWVDKRISSFANIADKFSSKDKNDGSDR
jgi:hypothetical protein